MEVINQKLSIRVEAWRKLVYYYLEITLTHKQYKLLGKNYIVNKNKTRTLNVDKITQS